MDSSYIFIDKPDSFNFINRKTVIFGLHFSGKTKLFNTIHKEIEEAGESDFFSSDESTTPDYFKSNNYDINKIIKHKTMLIEVPDNNPIRFTLLQRDIFDTVIILPHQLDHCLERFNRAFSLKLNNEDFKKRYLKCTENQTKFTGMLIDLKYKKYYTIIVEECKDIEYTKFMPDKFIESECSEEELVEIIKQQKNPLEDSFVLVD